MDGLDAILQAHVAEGHDTTGKLLGAAFAVVNKHGIVYSGAAGRIDFDPAARIFAGDSFTWVASLTKLVTTTCLMQLVERGAIGLDDDVRPRVPELAKLQILRGFDADDAPILEDNVKPVTLRMLLTHTLGLGYDLADPDLVKWSKKVGRAANNLEWSRQGFFTPLKFEPGDGWYYGTALDWAGFVLEQVTGQGLGQYMQQHVLDPLGLHDTGFWPERLPQTKPRTVAFSYRDLATSTLRPGKQLPPVEHQVESGGAGLFTTADDYARFLHGLLQGKLLSEATMREMFTPQLNEKQSNMLEFVCYHLGVQDGFAPEFPAGLALNHGIGGVINTEDVPGKRRKGSMMWSGMCNSHWWIDGETGIAAVLVVNVLDHGDAVVVSLFDELERAVYAPSGLQGMP
ncbi:beta-lactamase [Hirsutella rhossiliensis]|uniref:Beta-lactamase domain-containing protein n=1 Tax=Hirsutella rhossiliensis TaxID=111463 RepID=A0A9P8N7Z2_9HYPO|nr:beta-lactamase domain-containing protein [Hirsutella rhossiliensis]KAH0968212.1 beta-lactamase domain-containing protein [Hirsutella rhossiliensis]